MRLIGKKIYRKSKSKIEREIETFENYWSLFHQHTSIHSRLRLTFDLFFAKCFADDWGVPHFLNSTTCKVFFYSSTINFFGIWCLHRVILWFSVTRRGDLCRPASRCVSASNGFFIDERASPAYSSSHTHTHTHTHARCTEVWCSKIKKEALTPPTAFHTRYTIDCEEFCDSS
jgi:hypothetical protein